MKVSKDEWGHFEKVVIGNAVYLQFWDNNEQVIGQIKWNKIASQIPRDFRLTKDKMPEIITILTNCNPKDKTKIKQAIADALEISYHTLNDAIRRYYKKLYAEMNDKQNKASEQVAYELDFGSLDHDNAYDKIKEYIFNLKSRWVYNEEEKKSEQVKTFPTEMYDYIMKLYIDDDFYRGKSFFSLKALFDYAENEYQKAFGKKYHKNHYA